MLAFVLGGGGSRGALQVGALEALFAASIQPDLVIGTSVGAINAAFLASDPTFEGVQRLKEIWLHVQEDDVYAGSSHWALWNLLCGRSSLYSNENWLCFLKRVLPAEHFCDLPLPCYAVAVEMESGKVTVFGDQPQDSLIDGLMSSSALTPLHPGWKLGEHLYVDGGYSAALPLRQAIERGATEIIALNLINQRRPLTELKTSVDMLYHVLDLMLIHQVQTDLECVQQLPHVRCKVIDLKPPAYLFSNNFSQTQQLLELGRSITEETLSEALWQEI